MEYTTIGESCSVVSGGTPSRSKTEYWRNGTIPWIKIGNIKSKYVNEYDELITEQGLNNSSAKLLKKGTILYTIFATLGEVGILDTEACTNQAIAGININDPRITTDYLYYYLKSKKDYVNNIGRGVAQNNINLTILKKFEIPLINVDKQLYIVEVLEKVERMIGLKKKEIDDLDLLIKARFVELFGDPVQNPFGWKKKRFDEICENLDSRRKPITSSDRVVGVYPYYGASGIVDYVEDYIFDEDILLVSEDGANLLMRSTPIAFSVSGKVWVNNHAHVVRFKKMFLQKYIEILFSLIDISDSITGSAQPKLNQAKLNAMEFPIPDEDRLEKYLSFLEQVDKSKFRDFVPHK